jgi:DNA-binding GntR family transcriptional regulator
VSAEPRRAPVRGPLRVPTLVEEVVKGVTAMIMAAEFRPGERLVEERLAEIVTSVPRKGFTVIPISAEDVREIYELRWILERSALEVAVPLEDPARLAPLQRAIDRMAQQSAQSDPEEMLAANSEFHHALVSLAHNSRLSAAYATISTQLRVCMAMNLRFRRELYGDPTEAVRRHQVLHDLIGAGELAPLLAELQDHGDRSFMSGLDTLIGSPE